MKEIPRPDIDREDVVFVDGALKSDSIGETEDGIPVVIVNDDITRYASTDKKLVELVKESIGKLPYVAISKQKIYFVKDTKRRQHIQRIPNGLEIITRRYTEIKCDCSIIRAILFLRQRII